MKKILFANLIVLLSPFFVLADTDKGLSQFAFVNFLVETELEHMLAFVFGIMAVIIGLKAKKVIGGQIGKAFNFFFWGIFSLELIHGTEVLSESWELYTLPGEGQEVLEFILFYIGMILVSYGFYKIIRVITHQS